MLSYRRGGVKLEKSKLRWGVALTLVTVCSAVIGIDFNVFASSHGNVTATYSKEESEAYALSVYVTGEGSVSDGESVIRNEDKRYLVTLDETVTFELLPDLNGVIKEVTLNGEDVISKIRHNMITVQGQAKAQIMHVCFRTKESTGGSTQKPQKSNPQTGDVTRTGLYALLALGAAGTCRQMAGKRKKDSENSEEGGQKIE